MLNMSSDYTCIGVTSGTKQRFEHLKDGKTADETLDEIVTLAEVARRLGGEKE